MFEAKYITREVAFEPSEASMFGTRLHSALEMRIRDRISLPQEFRHLEWVGQLLDRYRLQGQVYVERKLAVDRNFRACAWDAWSTKYVNGKDDCTVILGDRAVTFDWKGGKVKTDTQQLQMLSLMTLAHHPEVQTVDSALVFFQGAAFVPYHVKRDTFMPDRLFEEFRRYEAAQEKGEYLPTPCGLCREHCPVTRCEFHGRGSNK
jgi:hypothetical protein